jgi:hypothetical protein
LKEQAAEIESAELKALAAFAELSNPHNVFA